MKTYLELERRTEGGLAQNPGPSPKSIQHKTIHNKHSHNQSNLAPTPKASDKRKRTVIAKRGSSKGPKPAHAHNYSSSDYYHIHPNANNRVCHSSHTSDNA